MTETAGPAPRAQRSRVKAALALALRGGGAGLQYLLTVAVARAGGATVVGEFTGYQAWTRLIASVSAIGLPQATLREVASTTETPNGARTVIHRSLRLGGLVAAAGSLIAIVALALLAATGLMAWATTATVIAFVVGGLGFAVVRIYSEGSKGAGHIGRGLGVEYMVVPLLFLVGLGAYWARDRAVSSLGVVALYTAAFTLVGLALTLGATLSWKRTAAAGDTALPRYPRRSLATLAVSASANVLIPAIPFAIIPFVGSSDDLGSFGVASRTVALATIILFALSATYSPRFAQFHSRRLRRELHGAVRQSSLLSLALYTPFFLTFLLVPGLIIGLFGTELPGAVAMLRILALGQLINAATGLSTELLVMTHHEHVEVRVTLFAALFLIGCGFALGSPFGGVGVAIAYALTLAGRNTACAVLGRRLTLSQSGQPSAP